MSNFLITNAGIEAVIDANATGPLIELEKFRVGSAFGYAATTGDTALHGTILHVGVIKNYQKINADTVQVIIEMNELVGDFDYGEIGIYTKGSDQLFAIFAYDALQQKRISLGNQVGDRIIIRAKMKLVNLSAALLFPIIQPGVGLPEVPNYSSLDPDLPEANAYSVALGDGCENSGLALFNSPDGLWTFPTHVTTFSGVASAGTGTTVHVSGQDVLNVLDVAPGRYILQVLDGVLKGFVREVDAHDGAGNFTFSPALTSPIPNGANVRIYQSNCYALGNAGAYWASAAEYNQLATRINAIVGTPNLNLSLSAPAQNMGYNDGDIPLLTVPQKPTLANWETLYNKLRRGLKHQGDIAAATVDAVHPTFDYRYRVNNPAGLGLETFRQRYADLSTGVVTLEVNKDHRNAATINQVLYAAGSGTTGALVRRQTTWTGTIWHSVLFTFVSTQHAHGFFNSGGRISLRPFYNGGADADDLAWATLLANNWAWLRSQDNCRSDDVVLGPVGYYDLPVAGGLQLVHTATDGSRTFNLYAERVTGASMTMKAEFVNGAVNEFGYGYAPGLVDANYGLFSQVALQRHDATYLGAIDYPTVGLLATNGFDLV